jgi:hypothetical protein
VGRSTGGSRGLSGIGGLSEVSRILAPSSRGRLSRAALLAGGSLVALGACAGPAEALCSGSNQTISAPETSTAQSDGGDITITSGGSIAAKLGIALFSAPNGCSAGTVNNAGSINYSTFGVINQNSITTLTNSGTIAGGKVTGAISALGGAGLGSSGTIGTLTNSGAISGGGAMQTGTTGNAALGGAAVNNVGAITTTFNNGGTISGGAATSSGVAAGAFGGSGVSSSGTVGTLTNTGTINGGAATSAVTSAGASTKALAGGGVSNSGAIGTLTNSGAINGGAAVGNGGLTRGGAGVTNGPGATITSLTNNAAGTIQGGKATGAASALGGVGLGNFGTIGTLTNNGAINGGDSVGHSGYDAVGGYGVLNGFASTATISNLTNGASGTIQGGDGTNSGRVAGGTGVTNYGTITTLTNMGTISGGAANSLAADAWGGLGIANAKVIGTLTNSGTIAGGKATGVTGAFGGTAIFNFGKIGTLSNSGTIKGGAGGGSGAAAIGSAGGGLGTIANTGSIIGDIYIKNQSVTITGGAATKFGNLTGLSSSVGFIDVENGNLTFASGATSLNDSIAVNGGTGTVYNEGSLMVATPLTITGGFDQTQTGELNLDFAGVSSSEYGSLYVSGGVTLNGELNLDVTSGFAFASGQTFDILGFNANALTGNFDSLLLDSQACISTIADTWTCGTTVFNESIDQSTGWIALDVRASSATIPAAFTRAAFDSPVGLYNLDVNNPPVPEPSTWAMMLIGFLGLAGLGLRKRSPAARGVRPR